MVASDLGFLALGGLLGTLAGAALLAVLRARPAAARRISLTVTPGSVPSRPWTTTPAGDPFAFEPSHSGRDRRADMDPWGPDIAFATDPGRGGHKGTSVRSGASSAATPGTPEASGPTSGAPGPETSIEPVGLSIGSGPDPVLAAIVASGGSGTSGASGTTGASGTSGATSEDVATEVPVDGVPVLIGRPSRPVALHLTAVGSGIAVLEAALRARRGSATHADVAGSVAVMTLAEPVPAASDPAAEAPSRGDSSGAPGSGGRNDAVPDDRGPAAAPAAVDQCAEARHTVDERCALAERMRLTAERADDALREAQRTFDVHVSHAVSAEAVAEPRAQRAAKDEAQNAFRTERGRAGSREAVEQAARDWLQEINRINASAHEAAATLLREREAAAALLPTIERLTIDADAARVQAESAEESCVMARESLAACEENARRAVLVATGDSGGGRHDGPEGVPGEAPIPVPIAAAAAGQGPGAAPEPAPAEEEGALVAAIRSGGHPALLGLLAGDRAVMQRLVLELAGADQVDQRRWQIQLADLVDAIVSRAIEACAFIFPDDHAFWAPFNRGQARDIALALSSLGFRFDGMGGFADDRVPTQRDVSLALGYAGLDPMRVRRWPEGAEFEELYREVTVAADEYILGAAPGLTLGELVGNLGRRADGLTEVWNAWGQIRAILLEEVG